MLRRVSWLEIGALAVFLGSALPFACGGHTTNSGVSGGGAGSGGREGFGLATDGNGPGASQNDGHDPGGSIDGAGPGTGYDASGHGDGSGPFPQPCAGGAGVSVADGGQRDTPDTGATGDGSPPAKLVCQRTGPNGTQKIECEKVVGQDVWSCHCTGRCGVTTCTTQRDLACGADNCCAFPIEGCSKQVVNVAPNEFCAASVASGAMTSCGHLRHLKVPNYGPFTSCCPPDAPFSCPTGTPVACFATAEAAKAACGDDCVECSPTSRADAIGLGQLCGGPEHGTCPAGSDCIVRPGPQAAPTGFCSPPCSVNASTPQCPYASAPPGIRTSCSGPLEGFLSGHCVIINDGCAATCPPGFNCRTGGCFPD